MPTTDTDQMLVFDGDCGFCTSSARWIEGRLPSDVAVEPWQSLDLDQIGLSVEDVTAAAWWIDADGRERGHRAIGRSLVAAGGIWRMFGRLILNPPVAWIARPVYALVARYRYRLPGATEACRVPSGD